MTATALLERLPGARQVSRGRWRSVCPSCGGTSKTKLSIGETDDGVALVTCFAGCTAAEVVQAVGLELADLFPRLDWPSTGKHGSRPRRLPRIDWAGMIHTCERDLLLVKIVLASIARSERLNDVDVTSCDAAATRVYTLIQEARRG